MSEGREAGGWAVRRGSGQGPPGARTPGPDSLGRGGEGRARRLDKGPRGPWQPNHPRRRELREPP